MSLKYEPASEPPIHLTLGLRAIKREREAHSTFGNAIHAVDHDTFIKSQLASPYCFQGLMWCKVGYESLGVHPVDRAKGIQTPMARGLSTQPIYRGTSLIINTPLLGPYSRTI